jgi:Zn-dependent M28 family amino/carboxypeptidase
LPSKKVNAYELADGTKLDVKDKIVIAASGLPKAIPVGDVVNGKVGVDYETPAIYAAKNGAKAVIFIPAERTLARWSRLRESAVKGSSFQMVRTGQDVSRIPAITASESLLKALFDGEKASGADILKKAADEPIAGFELSQKKSVSISVSGQAEQVMTQNVVAKIEGSDPTLKNEYVAFGAHYDHVGVGAPDKNGDAIYNGADDDGSGTTAILSLAEAIAKGPRPKRSFLFVWHCGEEKGLWGSEYFTDHPTVPLDKIVTQINIDMIGRSRPPGDKNSRNDRLTGPDEIYVIGSKMMSTELGQITEQVNTSYLKLKLNYKYDDPKDTERLFFRSDHFNYAKHGVPIIFYFDGVHEDYHRPSDEVSKIDFAKMEKVTRTVLATAWEVANRAERVKVDKKLPDELTRR